MPHQNWQFAHCPAVTASGAGTMGSGGAPGGKGIGGHAFVRASCPAPSRTVVAVDDSGTVPGTAKMNRNHMGNGSPIASAGYMADPAHAEPARCSSTRLWKPTSMR